MRIISIGRDFYDVENKVESQALKVTRNVSAVIPVICILSQGIISMENNLESNKKKESWDSFSSWSDREREYTTQKGDGNRRCADINSRSGKDAATVDVV